MCDTLNTSATSSSTVYFSAVDDETTPSDDEATGAAPQRSRSVRRLAHKFEINRHSPVQTCSQMSQSVYHRQSSADSATVTCKSRPKSVFLNVVENYQTKSAAADVKLSNEPTTSEISNNNHTGSTKSAIIANNTTQSAVPPPKPAPRLNMTESTSQLNSGETDENRPVEKQQMDGTHKQISKYQISSRILPSPNKKPPISPKPRALQKIGSTKSVDQNTEQQNCNQTTTDSVNGTVAHSNSLPRIKRPSLPPPPKPPKPQVAPKPKPLPKPSVNGAPSTSATQNTDQTAHSSLSATNECVSSDASSVFLTENQSNGSVLDLDESTDNPLPSTEPSTYATYDARFSSTLPRKKMDVSVVLGESVMVEQASEEASFSKVCTIAGNQLSLDDRVYQLTEQPVIQSDLTSGQLANVEKQVPQPNTQPVVPDPGACAEVPPSLPPRNSDITLLDEVMEELKRHPPIPPKKVVRLVDGELIPSPVACRKASLPTLPCDLKLRITTDDLSIPQTTNAPVPEPQSSLMSDDSEIYEDIDLHWHGDNEDRPNSPQHTRQEALTTTTTTLMTTTSTTMDCAVLSPNCLVPPDSNSVYRTPSSNNQSCDLPAVRVSDNHNNNNTETRCRSECSVKSISPVPPDPDESSRPPSRPPRPRRRQKLLRTPMHRSAEVLSSTPCQNNDIQHSNDQTKAARKKLFNKSSKAHTGLSDNLLRIKGDIKLNFSKQVGNIKLKVTSVAATSQQQLNHLHKRKFHARRKKKSQSVAYNKNVSNGHDAMVNSVNIPLDQTYGDLDLDNTMTDVVDYEWSDLDNDTTDDEFDEQSNAEYPELRHSSPEPEGSVPDVLHQSVMITSTISSTNSQSEPNLNTALDSDEEYNNSEIINRKSPTTIIVPPLYSPEPTDPETEIVNSPSSEFTQRPGSSAATVMSSSAEGSDRLKHQYHGRFVDEPLYQHIMLDDDVEDKNKTVSRMESISSSSSKRTADTVGETTGSSSAASTSRSSMRDRFTCASQLGSQRSLWCELPEVIASGCLETMSSAERKCQEAMFELITSEASYLRSLNVLITHFMATRALSGNAGLESAIDKRDRRHLFSNILAVRDCSEALLCDLEVLLDDSCVLNDVCAVLTKHMQHNFEVYVKYCTNQLYQDRTLKHLKATNVQFLSTVQYLESDRQCEGLDMRSFLMLPTQRITRYPLLVMAILDRTPNATQQHKIAARTLQLAHLLVGRCNDGAHRMERMEQLLEIDKRLVYRHNDMKRLPLVSSERYLVKQGTLFELVRNTDTTGLFRRKSSLNLLSSASSNSSTRIRRVHLLLFTDLLLVTKVKVDGLHVRDYASRAFVDVQPLEVGCTRVPHSHVACLPGLLSTTPHLFACTIMCGARGKQTEMIFCAESETDRQRWLSACRPPVAANADERVYAPWDCPRVRAVHDYVQQQDDELSLKQGDYVDVIRKMADGWYEGKRVGDNAVGWFPSSYVVEQLNDHVRARNYRQRLKLIQAAESLQFERLTTRSGSSEAPSPSPTDAAIVRQNQTISATATRYKKRAALRSLYSSKSHSDYAECIDDTRNEAKLVQRLRRLSNPMGGVWKTNKTAEQINE